MARLLLISSIILLVSCGGQLPSKITSLKSLKLSLFSDEHVVRDGETLYQIAWKRKLNYKDLAEINGIEPPYRIFVGQKLKLQDDAEPKPKKVVATRKPAARTNTVPNTSWRWPARGPILKEFNTNRSKLKGIDIGGKSGAPIVAASAGEVVYSGNGLRGYGNLIIIKHPKNFISAYAHNRKNIVKEGDTVRIGQQIAEMGDSESKQVKLHFEVRHKGNPIDPRKVLPKS